MFHQINRPSYPPETNVVPAERHAGHVTLVTTELFGLRLGLVQVDLANREIGTTAENSAAMGLPPGQTRCRGVIAP